MASDPVDRLATVLRDLITAVPAATAPSPPESYSAARVAALLDVGLSTAKDLIRRGALPSYRIGHRVLVSRQALERFVAEREAEEACRRADAARFRPPPTSARHRRPGA